MGVRRRLRPPGVLSGWLPGACRFEHEPDIRGELPGVEDAVAVWSGMAVLRAGSAEGAASVQLPPAARRTLAFFGLSTASARSSGVAPESSRAFTFAPASRRTVRTSGFPLSAA